MTDCSATLSFAELVATKLHSLIFMCQGLPLMPFRSGFFACCPVVRHLSLEFNEMEAPTLLPDQLSNRSPATASKLRTMRLSLAMLEDTVHASFPVLTELHMTDVFVNNLAGLLRQMPALIKLHVVGLHGCDMVEHRRGWASTATLPRARLVEFQLLNSIRPWALPSQGRPNDVLLHLPAVEHLILSLDMREDGIERMTSWMEQIIRQGTLVALEVKGSHAANELARRDSLLASVLSQGKSLRKLSLPSAGLSTRQVIQRLPRDMPDLDELYIAQGVSRGAHTLSLATIASTLDLYPVTDRQIRLRMSGIENVTPPQLLDKRNLIGPRCAAIPLGWVESVIAELDMDSPPYVRHGPTFPTREELLAEALARRAGNPSPHHVQMPAHPDHEGHNVVFHSVTAAKTALTDYLAALRTQAALHFLNTSPRFNLDRRAYYTGFDVVS